MFVSWVSQMSNNNRVCLNTLTMVNIIYSINLNHLYSTMFLFLTLFVSMILQLATISYVSQCCAQIIKSLFSLIMKESTTPVIAWFTQPDILANDRGYGRGCLPATYKPCMTIGICLGSLWWSMVLSQWGYCVQCLLKGTLHFHHRWQQSSL